MKLLASRSLAPLRAALVLAPLCALSIFATSEPAAPALSGFELVVQRASDGGSALDDAFRAEVADAVGGMIVAMELDEDLFTHLQQELEAAGHRVRQVTDDVRYIQIVDPITGEIIEICIEGLRLEVADPQGGPSLEVLQVVQLPG